MHAPSFPLMMVFSNSKANVNRGKEGKNKCLYKSHKQFKKCDKYVKGN